MNSEIDMKTSNLLYATCLIAIFLISAPSLAYLNTVHADATPPLLPGTTMAPNAVVLNAATAPSLKWTNGQPYPVVNGHAVPPIGLTGAVNSTASPATVGGTWFAGGLFSGKSSLQTWVLSEISVPSTPSSGVIEFYYVPMDIYDNGGSLDVVGFSGDYGTWGLAYQYTTGPCTSPTYHTNPDYMTLAGGQEYLLAITTAAAPGTDLEVYTVSSTGTVTMIFDLHAPTGATNPGLEVSKTYCGEPNYAVFEQVIGTTSYKQPDPYDAPGGFTWYFHGNVYQAGTAPYTYATWKAYKSSNAPPGTVATIGKYNGKAELVTIENYKSLSGYISG
jgi:hypothetical protein